MIRLAGLQFVESPELSEVEASRETKDVPLAAIRGLFTRRAGKTSHIPHRFSRYSLR